jgi:hypothetical protein
MKLRSDNCVCAVEFITHFKSIFGDIDWTPICNDFYNTLQAINPDDSKVSSGDMLAWLKWEYRQVARPTLESFYVFIPLLEDKAIGVVDYIDFATKEVLLRILPHEDCDLVEPTWVDAMSILSYLYYSTNHVKARGT